jgi:hypothetical protein
MFNSLCVPFFEAALEIAYDHIKDGDEVYLPKCKEELPICKYLYKLDKEQCMRCQVRFESGIKKIGLPRKNILKINNDKSYFNLIPKEFKDVDELKEFKYDDIEFGLAAASTIITMLRDHRIDTIKYKKTVYNTLKTSFIVYNTYKKLHEKYNFDKVYMFHGRGAEYRIIFDYCKKMSIDVYVFDKFYHLNRHFIAKNYLTHEIGPIQEDINNCWENGNINKETIGHQFFIDKKNRNEESKLMFASNQIIGKLPDNFDCSKQNIAIFNSSLDEFETIESWKNHIYENEIDGLNRIFEDFKNNNSVHFYLRIHPNLSNLNNTQTKELNKIKTIGYKNVTIIPAEDFIDTYSLMDSCDKILVFGSTMGIEAAYWMKPAILAGRSYYENLNCTYNPNTHEEVVDLLKSNLSPKNIEGSLKYAYWLMEGGVPYKYFEPDTLYSGKFMGEQLNAEITKKHRYILRFHKNIKKIKKLFQLHNNLHEIPE